MNASSNLQTLTQRGGGRLRPVTGALVATAGALTLLAGFSHNVAAAQPIPTEQVALHNAEAEFELDCPSDGAAYWHFVAAPASKVSFVSIHLNLDEDPDAELDVTVEHGGIIINSGPGNVFVAVPDGYELTSIETSGSYAVVSPVGEVNNFNLSHLCAAVPPPTTATVPETTVPPTTIVDSGGPTTIVASGGPTTDPPVLPSTGNTGSNPMVMVGSVLALLGGVIALLARRISPLS